MASLIVNGRGDEKTVFPLYGGISKEFDSPHDLDSSKWFDEARRREGFRKDTEDSYDYCKIEMESNKPVIIGLTGDWHLGQDINLEMLYRDVDVLTNSPHVRGVFFLGDLTDSANFNPAQDETMFSFEEQKRWMMSILKQVGKDRILAVWKGNHDHKWESKGGVSKYADISRMFNTPVFYGNAYAEVVINGISYRIMGSHQLRGNSIYTNAHPSVRGHREVQGVDIVMCGHTHKKGVVRQSVREFNGARPILAVVSGTYEYGTGYTKDSGFGNMHDPEQGMWWLVLGHNEKRFNVMDTESMLDFSSRLM